MICRRLIDHKKRPPAVYVLCRSPAVSLAIDRLDGTRTEGTLVEGTSSLGSGCGG